MIIAFSTRTSKILPRLLCRRFRHCAPILCTHGARPFVMYQFVRRRFVAKIRLAHRDINILRANGWEFICVPRAPTPREHWQQAFSCVDMTKRAMGMYAPLVQTPNGLYKKIAPMGRFFIPLHRRGGTECRGGLLESNKKSDKVI